MNIIAWIVMSFFLFFSGIQIKVPNALNVVQKILRRNFHLLAAHVLLIQALVIQEVHRAPGSVAAVEGLHFAKP